MPEYIVRDFPHYTVSVLLSTIRQKSAHAYLGEVSGAVLRSSFNHLFISNYTEPDAATGQAMSQLLMLMEDHRRG
jgi:hypothetical protein